MPEKQEKLKEELEVLQAEIQALKAHFGRSLRLQRATTAEAPATAPFPITLTFSIDPPPAAAHYDVSTIQIQIRLSREALSLPRWAAAAMGLTAAVGSAAAAAAEGPRPTHGSQQHRRPPVEAPPGTELLVLSEELPKVLRNRIAQELRQAWCAALGVGARAAATAGGGAAAGSVHGVPYGPYQLVQAVACLQERFVPLICLVPELVEPYQADDTYGATVRRYAILNNDGGAVGMDAERTSGGDDSVAASAGAAPSIDSVDKASVSGGDGGGGGGGGDDTIGCGGAGRSGGGGGGGPPTALTAPARPSAVPETGPAPPAATALAAVSLGAPAAGPNPVVAAPVGAAAAVSGDCRTGSDGATSTAGASTPGLTPPSRAEVNGQRSTPAAGVSEGRTAGDGDGATGGAPSAAAATGGAPSAAAATGGAPSAAAATGGAPSAAAATPGFAAEAGAAAEADANVEACVAAWGCAGGHSEPASTVQAQSPPAQSAPPPVPPTGLLSCETALKELQYIQKRYSQVFSARVIREDAGGASPSSYGTPHHRLVQPECLTTFDLELLPTDPDWDLPAVRVVGQLLPVSSNTFLPSLGVHMACRLPPLLRGALEAHMAQQLAMAAAEAMAAVAAAEAAVAAAVAPGAAAAAAVSAPALVVAGDPNSGREDDGGLGSQVHGDPPDASRSDVPGPGLGCGSGGPRGLSSGNARSGIQGPGRRGRGFGGAGCRGAAASAPTRAGAGGGGGGGGGGDAGAESRTVAPSGTVLLPLGCLRNLFRDLENYAGAIARAAEAERRRQEREVERERQRRRDPGRQEAAGRSDGSCGDEEGSLPYDDDGYGDGSYRRDDGAGAPAGAVQGQGSEYDDTSGGDDDEDDDEDEDGDGEGSGDGAPDEVRFSGAAAASGADLPAAYAVVLEGLQLDNLAVVEVLRANFEVSCARCDARGTLVASSSAVAGGTDGGGGGGGGGRQRHPRQQQHPQQPGAVCGTCPRCTTEWSLVMRPHYVHATSNSLCAIKPQGCRPRDLLPCMMAGQCAQCSAVMSLREVQVGLPFTRTCSSCHKELLISVTAVSFIPRGRPHQGGRAAGGAGGAGIRATGAQRPRGGAGGGCGGGGGGGVLQPGQPLPALGTCKHYRHSYRWLRFPCCGMRFPCDLCHEEAVPDGHPVRWAQRMVCGFCSTEQPMALGCGACGRQLAGSAANPSGRRTRFWEGGTGCRDPRRLNKNDPHKFRGRNKTQSAKSSRVGPKPWSGKGDGGGGSGA